MNNLQGPTPVPSGWTHLIEPFTNPKGLVCHTDAVVVSFLTFLLSLQAMMIIWSFFILRLVVQMFKGENADDPRSDEEDETMESRDENEAMHNEPKPIEKVVDVDAIQLEKWRHFKGYETPAANSTSLRISSSSDRADLLKRIGCEKQID